MDKSRIAENLYDIIKVLALSDDQNDDWATLSRKHTLEASKEMYRFLKHKNMEWDNNQIKIGKHITIIIK